MVPADHCLKLLRALKNDKGLDYLVRLMFGISCFLKYPSSQVLTQKLATVMLMRAAVMTAFSGNTLWAGHLAHPSEHFPGQGVWFRDGHRTQGEPVIPGDKILPLPPGCQADRNRTRSFCFQLVTLEGESLWEPWIGDASLR